MVQVIQDRERLLPGSASLPRIPGSVADVTEVTEGLGQAPAAAAPAMQVS